MQRPALTTFLVDLWRDKPQSASSGSPARGLLADHAGEDFTVPAHAAGESPEGGAAVSEARLTESLQFLQLFRIGEVGVETALRYAKIVASLRRENALAGRSRPNLWIAAWAVEHDAPLATRNLRHFADVEGLEVLGY